MNVVACDCEKTWEGTYRGDQRITCSRCGRPISRGAAILATRVARPGGGPLITRYTHTQCYPTPIPQTIKVGTSSYTPTHLLLDKSEGRPHLAPPQSPLTRPLTLHPYCARQ